MVHAARKAAAEPRELVLKPNFALGPVRLEAVLEEVRGFYRREALLYAGGDESKASLLFTRE
jgi:hypothetical protein